MRFVVIRRQGRVPSDPLPVAVLERDSWNDYGFRTMFHLRVIDSEGRRHNIGTVKIGRYGMTDRRDREVEIPETFDSLTDQYFSLGQEDLYYARLAGLGDDVREAVLAGLQDMAFQPEILESALNEPVTQESILRFVKPTTIREQFFRIARGGPRILDFRVTYRLPHPGGDEDDELRLTFRARPGASPPNHIHVLTGRNGAGKSVLLNRLAGAAANPQADRARVGRITESGRSGRRSFTNLVCVSFSAFDELPRIPDGDQFPTDNVGLRAQTPASSPKLKTPERLRKDFAASVEACLTGGHSERWTKALETLDYAESGLLENGWLERFRATTSSRTRRTEARRLFRQASSGHKVALLTITRLVELVGERTLVIIDEPETHLHPPLLSALVRAVSDLLTERNALAIVATHSPVVLQEVPADCVYKLRRFGNLMVANRPTLETFGENVGVLTHEVFGLEVTHTGFHQAISRLVSDGHSYESILRAFEQKLGSEAQILTRSLVATREFGEFHGEES
ncbi:AAA family ATPase [Kitasatospora sp. NPDC057965]|uniref:AAA family ATPase n=1 Tax=Kitasatospora sp. NPDC057965 TaxID=3346291 RepID=UPI0036D827AF